MQLRLRPVATRSLLCSNWNGRTSVDEMLCSFASLHSGIPNKELLLSEVQRLCCKLSVPHLCVSIEKYDMVLSNF